MSNPFTPARSRTWLTVLGLALLLVVAAWLRWTYLHNVSLHVDEFTTLWAAKQITQHGWPQMPSGVLYTRGILHTYLEAGVMTSWGESHTVGRAASLITGLLTILVVWVVGRRGWRASVGWLAALALALLPEAIVWSARARFYAQLQLFVLLALWAAWEGMRVPIASSTGADNTRRAWRWQLLFALCFVLAIFSQEQAILLWPSVLLAGIVWRGRRWLLTPPVLTAHMLCIVAIIARFAIEIAGQPGYFETIQATRPYVGWVFDVVGAWRSYAPQFVAWDRLPWTLGALLAGSVALVVAVRARAVQRIAPFHQSTLYYALHLLTTLAVLFLLVGTSWREARYLFLIQPVWLLLGAAGMVWLAEWLAARIGMPALARGLPAVVGVALALLMLPNALQITTQQVEGYDRVLATVNNLRAPGDAILSPQPPACALETGAPCDGYAIQRGYEEFVIPDAAGALVDRWSGAPLVATVEELESVIRAHARTWFVSDSFRLATRYEADYLRTLIEQFDVVTEEQGVLALRADGWREQPELTVTEVISPPLRFGALELVGFARNDNFGGEEPLIIELLWRGDAQMDAQINTSIRIVNAAGEVVAQEDGPPARGMIPTTLFFDTPLPDRKALTLPVDLPNARYRVDVAAYTVNEPITQQGAVQPIWWFPWFSTHAPLTPPLGAWQNGLVLLGADTTSDRARADGSGRLAAGDTLRVNLQWWTEAALTTDLTAFVQLLSPAGEVVAQDDHQPEDGFYPTSAWEITSLVQDDFTLTLPARLPAGEYRLISGWYDPATNERVATATGEDALLLKTLLAADAP